jgi:hypothetical protein
MQIGFIGLGRMGANMVRRLLRDGHHGRPDKLGGRHLRDVQAVLAGDPVNRRVEVGTDVLAGREGVPVPGRPAVVVAAQLLQGEARGVHEGLGQLDDRRLVRQRGG